LGTTWQGFNQGLVGGVLDSQLDVTDLKVLGDSMYAATAGAGVYVRRLTGVNTWHPFGTVLEPEQASNVNALGAAGGRLLATAGGNGEEFFVDRGGADWTISFLDNIGLHAGLQGSTTLFTGTGWLVGSNLGVFRSPLGQSPWTRSDPGFGPLRWIAFAQKGGPLFAAFDLAV